MIVEILVVEIVMIAILLHTSIIIVEVRVLAVIMGIILVEKMINGMESKVAVVQKASSLYITFYICLSITVTQ